MKTEEFLKKLSDSISYIYDLDLAEEMTDISIGLSNNINEMSERYWSLVRRLAIVEKERDELRKKLNEERWLRSKEDEDESRVFGGKSE